MLNNELYRSLYSKYAPELSEQEVNQKINYASNLDTMEFINAFYQKYTGQGPNQDQLNYINSIIEQPESKEEVVVPQVDVDINITEKIQQKLTSLGLSGEEFERYQQGIKNAIIEVENEMPAIIKQTEKLEDVVEMRTEKSSAGGILSGMNVKSPEKIIVGKRYVFHEFLNEDKSNIEDAKERWIQQERQKLQTVKLEEVFSELKSDVMPTWTKKQVKLESLTNKN